MFRELDRDADEVAGLTRVEPVGVEAVDEEETGSVVVEQLAGRVAVVTIVWLFSTVVKTLVVCSIVVGTGWRDVTV